MQEGEEPSSSAPTLNVLVASPSAPSPTWSNKCSGGTISSVGSSSGACGSEEKVRLWQKATFRSAISNPRTYFRRQELDEDEMDRRREQEAAYPHYVLLLPVVISSVFFSLFGAFGTVQFGALRIQLEAYKTAAFWQVAWSVTPLLYTHAFWHTFHRAMLIARDAHPDETVEELVARAKRFSPVEIVHWVNFVLYTSTTNYLRYILFFKEQVLGPIRATCDLIFFISARASALRLPPLSSAPQPLGSPPSLSPPLSPPPTAPQPSPLSISASALYP